MTSHFPRRLPLLIAACLITLATVCGLLATLSDAGQFVAPGLAALGMSYALRDQELIKTKALPDGAAAITTDGIDLQHDASHDFVANCEFLITAPALTTAELPDAETMTYDVETDSDSAFGSATTLISGAIVQTGAGGAGAAADTYRFRVPSDVERYIRVKATNSGAGDATGKSVTFESLF